MDISCSYLSFSETKHFSKLALDYLQHDEKLQPFLKHAPNLAGIQQSVADRMLFNTDRVLLVSALRDQYKNETLSTKQEENLDDLLEPNCFTITTAHQPNIFTGPLYFIYKILHAIRLADELNELMPEKLFVPIYYMGSEDADLDELGHIFLGGEKINWETKQTGAVGRMNKKGLEKIIERLEGEFGHLPFGAEMVAICKEAYLGEGNIQQATLKLVQSFFGRFGLLVLIPDNPLLKKRFESVVERELKAPFSYPLVQQTIEKIGLHYKVQTAGRPINLFYLSDDGSRNRIEVAGLEIKNEFETNLPETTVYTVVDKGLSFSQAEILAELKAHPERFSANVILRGVFQETILPNIVFIGGGGELAYWLELKTVFEAAAVPFPVLMLRNSFLLKGVKEQIAQQKAGFADADLFNAELDLIDRLVAENTDEALDSKEQMQALRYLYEQLQLKSGAIDLTLKPHVAALQTRAMQGLMGLEKKWKRAARRKQSDSVTLVKKLKAVLFPTGNLQERVDNFMPFYAKYGPEIIDEIYKHSPAIEPAFCVVNLEKGKLGKEY